MQCEGIPVRGLSLVVFIVAVEVFRCQYERAVLSPCGYAPACYIFCYRFFFLPGKNCNSQASAPPEYAEMGADPYLQPHVSGILGSLLQKCRKK